MGRCEGEGRGRGECGDACVSLSFEPAVAEGCCGKKRRSGGGRTEIIGKNEENTEAAIWRSTGVRGGDNKGTEIEWRPSRGMSPCDPAERPTTCLALIASFPRSIASPDPPRHKQTPRAVVLSPLRSRLAPLNIRTYRCSLASPFRTRPALCSTNTFIHDRSAYTSLVASADIRCPSSDIPLVKLAVPARSLSMEEPKRLSRCRNSVAATSQFVPLLP